MLYLLSTLLALIVAYVAAQTSTSCNPTNTTCPADPGYDVATTTYNFQQQAPGTDWIVLGSGDQISQDSNGLHFSIDADGQAPTLCSEKYIFFGTVTATLEAAPGAGIVSAFILQSDDLDEIDWEWLGGATTDVQTNYFSKGNTTTYDRGGTSAVTSPQTESHTYSISWSTTEIDWIIDGTVVRTLTAASAGDQYPQTPAQVRIGTWCGGCASEPAGTIQWAGGPTTFSGAPYVMTITSLTIENANPGGSYTYGDMTGDWQSIKIGGAVATNNTNTVDPPSNSTSQSSTSSTSSTKTSSISTTATAGNSTTAAAKGTQGATSSQNTQSVSLTTENIGPTKTTLSLSGASTTSVGGALSFVIAALYLLLAL